jgi:hypothetical protein
VGQWNGDVGAGRERDQREAVLRAEPGNQVVDRGPGVADLLAVHRARTVEDDDEIRGQLRCRVVPAALGPQQQLHPHQAVTAFEHGRAVQGSANRNRAIAGRADGRVCAEAGKSDRRATVGCGAHCQRGDEERGEDPAGIPARS